MRTRLMIKGLVLLAIGIVMLSTGFWLVTLNPSLGIFIGLGFLLAIIGFIVALVGFLRDSQGSGQATRAPPTPNVPQTVGGVAHTATTTVDNTVSMANDVTRGPTHEIERTTGTLTGTVGGALAGVLGELTRPSGATRAPPRTTAARTPTIPPAGASSAPRVQPPPVNAPKAPPARPAANVQKPVDKLRRDLNL